MDDVVRDFGAGALVTGGLDAAAPRLARAVRGALLTPSDTEARGRAGELGLISAGEARVAEAGVTEAEAVALLTDGLGAWLGLSAEPVAGFLTEELRPPTEARAEGGLGLVGAATGLRALAASAEAEDGLGAPGFADPAPKVPEFNTCSKSRKQ